jgi:hypothetical protein
MKTIKIIKDILNNYNFEDFAKLSLTPSVYNESKIPPTQSAKKKNKNLSQSQLQQTQPQQLQQQSQLQQLQQQAQFQQPLNLLIFSTSSFHSPPSTSTTPFSFSPKLN